MLCIQKWKDLFLGLRLPARLSKLAKLGCNLFFQVVLCVRARVTHIIYTHQYPPSNPRRVVSPSKTRTFQTKAENNSNVSSISIALNDHDSISNGFCTSNPPATVLYVNPCISCYYVSACCNHITNNSALFSTKAFQSRTPSIQAVDGFVIYIGNMCI